MEFGTLILCEKLIRRDFEYKNGQSAYRTKVDVAKFLFQRPDNRQILCDYDGSVIQCDPSTVYILNPANVQVVKQLIQQQYEKRVEEVRKEISKLRTQVDNERTKVTALEENIKLLQLKNQEEMSANRSKNIQGLSKALRRHSSRVENMEERIQALETKTAELHAEAEYSVDIFMEEIREVISC